MTENFEEEGSELYKQQNDEMSSFVSQFVSHIAGGVSPSESRKQLPAGNLNWTAGIDTDGTFT